MRQKIACWMLLLVLCLPLLRPVTADAIVTKLRVGFVQNQAPYHFVDDTGEIVGMHIDMLNHIARRTGCGGVAKVPLNCLDVIAGANGGNGEGVTQIVEAGIRTANSGS